MQGLAEGVKAYGEEQGLRGHRPGPQARPAEAGHRPPGVIESGAVAGAWAIAIAPPSMTALVQTALDKGVPLILNGTPEDYGQDGLVPGLSFSTIDYEAQGTAAGEELGNCINERLRRQGRGPLRRVRPRHRRQGGARERRQGGARRRRARRRDRHHHHGQRPHRAQTDVGSALQGNPDVTAVYGQNDEGALGTIGAFKAAGKDMPCITEAGGNDEVLAAVEAGDIYAVVALQFQADMAQSFDTLIAMIEDPEAEGVQLTVPQEVVKAEG